MSIIASDVNAILKYSLNAINPYQLLRSALLYQSDNTLCVQGRAYKLRNNVKLIAAGKAVGGMVRAVQDLIGDHVIKGVVSLPLGYTDTFKNRKDLYPLPSPKVNIFEGGKDNLPDEQSLTASRAIYQLADGASIDELIIVLLSGGASTLTSLPISGLSIDNKRFICSSLSQRGASINELNTVRKHVSLLKGGKLVQLCQPAEVLTLILSDVINDPLDIIASGPCYPDSSTGAEFLAILHKYEITSLISRSIIDSILQTSSYRYPPLVSTPQHVIVGNNKLALDGAMEYAIKLGYDGFIWSSKVSGSVVEVASFYAAFILHSVLCIFPHDKIGLKHEAMERCLKVLGISSTEDSITIQSLYESYHEILTSVSSEKVCLLSGGEPVVKVKGDGKGGRNQELSLRVGINLDLIYDNFSCILDGIVNLEKFREFWDLISIEFASVGTDGQDGPTPVAGAKLSQKFMRDNEKYRDFIHSSLSRNDSFTLFSKLGYEQYLIHTELTGTNVMDIHLILISV
ncbi:Glycerate kinase [Oopsacas minuta]|uniref:Glycerate kinase n=1 Tax=Oopsacas minuta TaxID=111878 RepID=A0AAV7K2L8_9METZ|nr:Glycerate kinase [Oopsacas minuta]